MKTTLAFLTLALLGLGAQAARYDMDTTPQVIYGGGNTNGGWTLSEENDYAELGLRAKVRYDLSDDLPKNIWNSNGDGSYSHAAGAPAAQPARARWNFDWSIFSETGLNQLNYELWIDLDPSANKNFVKINPLAWIGTSFGTLDTLQGEGVEGWTQEAHDLLRANDDFTVQQGSQNLAFLGLPFNPQLDAMYSFELHAFVAGRERAVSSTAIDVIVGNGPGNNNVPEPGALALAGLALLGAGLARRRG